MGNITEVDVLPEESPIWLVMWPFLDHIRQITRGNTEGLEMIDRHLTRSKKRYWNNVDEIEQNNG